MTVPEHIAGLTSPKFSFELLPPVKGSSIETIYDNLDRLVEFKPPYINITYHREELNYIKQADGTAIASMVRKRPGTVAIASSIQARYKIDVVPHIICGGFTRQETEDALIDLDFLGIHNLLALRGDGEKLSGRFIPNPRGNKYASELVEQIMNMNKGKYLEDYIENPYHTNFSVGVAGYPEKHEEAPNMDDDLYYLKQKVDKGADYVVTQMFFDNRVFFNFVNKCREIGINVPIIPGIKPIAVKDHLNILPKIFRVSIPHELAAEVQKCTSNAQVRQLGVQWTTAQIKELFREGFPVAHIYTMSKADNIIEIAKNCL
jgi:methylenetetrahydrofolate reductase (NADPH)